MAASLVLGASGAIGRFLVPSLAARGREILALSRVDHPPRAGVTWLIGDLCDGMPDLPPLDAIFSLGPLDGLARWLSQARLTGRPRRVAIGSMSIDSKRASPDAGERALAARLADAERTVAAAAARLDLPWTLLRPTLIYGAGLDRSLTPLARAATRWRVFPRIRSARGLRQPLHAADLAAACLAVEAVPLTHGKTYALGGGERIGVGAMLERVRASLPVSTLPLPVPLLLLRLVAAATRHGGAVPRLVCDQVADHTAAARDFGWSPRPFHPDAGCWTPPGSATASPHPV
jgi:nucleoside-diphosphate-sugar epimerase